MKWVLFFLILMPAISRAQLIYSLDDDQEMVRHSEEKYKKVTGDSARAYDALKLYVMFKLIKDTSKAGDYYRLGMGLAPRTPFVNAASKFYQAHALYASGDIPAIEKLMFEGDSLLRPFKHKEACRMRAYLWHALGTFQQMKGDEKAAMKFFLDKALPNAEKSGDEFVRGNVCKAIAIVCMNANRRTDARNYLSKAFEAFNKAEVTNPTLLESKAETLITAAENEVELRNADSAAVYLKLAHRIISSQPQSNLFLNYSYSEGVYLNLIGEYKQSLETLNKGISMAKKNSVVFWQNRLAYVKYSALSKLNRYSEAADVMKQLVESPATFLQDKSIYYKDLYQSLLKAGRKAEALDYAIKYIDVSDSINKANVHAQVTELNEKYKHAEDQKKIAALQTDVMKKQLNERNQHLLFWIIVLVASLALMVAGFWLRIYKNRKTFAEQQTQLALVNLNDEKQKQKLLQIRALMEGEEKERRRLAADLHDGLGGSLAGLKLKLSSLEVQKNSQQEIEAISQELDHLVADLRSMASNLMPVALESRGLEPALADLCAKFNSNRMKVLFQAFDLNREFSQELQLHIYRIVQELLGNALKHAEATQVMVQCSYNSGQIIVTVEDDGKGFNLSEVEGKGVGLSALKNRVGLLGGHLEFNSSPGNGTEVNIVINP